MTKSAAKVSKEDSRRPPCEPPRRARVSRASHAWQVRAVRDKAKVGSFVALHNLNYTTRANISHEKAEQIRARIVCTPAESALAGVDMVSARTKARIFASLLQWGIDRFAKQTRSASPRLGQKVSATG